MKLVRQKTYSTYHEIISRVIKKNQGKLSPLEQARVTDALEGVIERSRRRNAGRLYNVEQAKNSLLGSTVEHPYVAQKDLALDAATRRARKVNLDNKETQLIKKRARKLNL